MDFDNNIEYLRLAFWQIILAAGPILGVALAIGLLVGILQAATSINEMTLSFVPKLILVLLTIALLSGFLMTELSDYFAFIFEEIAAVGR
jgi:flagellar biosynthesis protein FliQ